MTQHQRAAQTQTTLDTPTIQFAQPSIVDLMMLQFVNGIDPLYMPKVTSPRDAMIAATRRRVNALRDKFAEKTEFELAGMWDRLSTISFYNNDTWRSASVKQVDRQTREAAAWRAKYEEEQDKIAAGLTPICACGRVGGMCTIVRWQ